MSEAKQESVCSERENDSVIKKTDDNVTDDEIEKNYNVIDEEIEKNDSDVIDDENDDDYMDISSANDSDEDYAPTPKKPAKKRATVKKEPKSPKKVAKKPRAPRVKKEKASPAKKKVKAENPDADGQETGDVNMDPSALNENKKPKATRKRKAKDTDPAEKPKKRAPPKKRQKVDKMGDIQDININGLDVKNEDSANTLFDSLLDAKAAPMENNCSDINFKEHIISERRWSDEELVTQTTNVPMHITRNILKLLNQECTIPFIARYRKEMTGDLAVEKIREVQISYEAVKALHKRVDNILKALVKEEKADPKIISDFMNAKSAEEVEFLYAPFKPGNKKSLAERSKQLGLLPVANNLLDGKISFSSNNLAPLINTEKPGIATEAEVVKGIQHIIADIVAKDREIMDFIHNHPQRQYIQITAGKSASAVKEEKKAYVEGKQLQNFKFENYYNFRSMVRQISSHQVMALNRGENQKVLTVKLTVSPRLKDDILNKIKFNFIRLKRLDGETSKFVSNCIDDAYNRLLEPHLIRQIRSELTKKANKESCDVFCANLKRLLLTPPIRGKTVIGIDPGFAHGCKVSVVSCKGDVLTTDVMYPHKQGKFNHHLDIQKIIHLVQTFEASVIAIGNGTACRETEAWLSNLIKNQAFSPRNIKYCIVNESGASIYSITKEAEADLPGMDPNIRSAVSIARRLQDPLLEYVKVEPKHLGVGMYQHDLPEAMLKSALDSVVVECVSFVGVDLNVCPEVLLRKISGLSASRAKQIIEWREKNGSFVNRRQLLDVKGLGPKSFEQCAGFVKILPQTSVTLEGAAVEAKAEPVGKKKKSGKGVENHKHNPLDSTIIHPESYDIAEKLLLELKSDIAEVGKDSLLQKVSNYMKFGSVQSIAGKLKVAPEPVKLIIDVFRRPIEYDIRQEFDVPLFQTGVKSFNDLKTDQVLTGRVMNVTHFGAFVDVGVGVNGLIHVSKMRRQTVQLGDTVSVKVLSIDAPKKKLGLELVVSR